MKIFTTIILLLIGFNQLKAQDENSTQYQPPIPVEIMIGNNSSMYEMVVSKRIMNSKFNFYNLINYEVDYDELTPNTYFIQSIVSYDLSKGFSIGVGGNLQTYNEFKPLIAASYAYFSESIGFFIQPSYEIHKDGAFELYSLFEWTPTNDKKMQPYLKISAYTSWKDIHSFSYNYVRAGLNYKSFRFGPALNIQYFGDNFKNNLNWGGFVNILIQ